MSNGQDQLSTRALEIATKAYERLDQHLGEHARLDAERLTIWQELREELRGMRTDLGGSISRLHGRIDEIKTANATLRLKIAGGVITLLLVILGAIVMKGLPWQ